MTMAFLYGVWVYLVWTILGMGVLGSIYLSFVFNSRRDTMHRIRSASNQFQRKLHHIDMYIHDRRARRNYVYGRELADDDAFYTPVAGDGEGTEDDGGSPDHLPPGAPRMTGEVVGCDPESDTQSFEPGDIPPGMPEMAGEVVDRRSFKAEETRRGSNVPVALSPEVPALTTGAVDPPDNE